MSWHRAKEVNRAFVGLMDALVSWERNTGRRSKLFFFPEPSDEEIIFLDDGKPVNWNPLLIVTQLEMIVSKLKGEGGSLMERAITAEEKLEAIKAWFDDSKIELKSADIRTLRKILEDDQSMGGSKP